MRTTIKIVIPAVAVLGITAAGGWLFNGPAAHAQPARARLAVYCHTGVSQAGGKCTEGTVTALRISGARVTYAGGQWVAQAA
jgi:hypothetical protein